MEEAAAGGQGTPEDVSSAPRTETYHYSASSNPTLEGKPPPFYHNLISWCHLFPDQLFELVRLTDVPMSKQLYDVVRQKFLTNSPLLGYISMHMSDTLFEGGGATEAEYPTIGHPACDENPESPGHPVHPASLPPVQQTTHSTTLISGM